MGPDQIILEDFINKHPFSAARTLDRLEVDEVMEFIQELPMDKSLNLLGLMNTDKAATCFMKLPIEKSKTLLENCNQSLSLSLCRHFDQQFLNTILGKISPKKSADLKQRLAQIPNTVGVWMVPVVVASKDTNVQDAIELIRRNSEKVESYLYVVDLHGSFEGAVPLKQLLSADNNVLLEELMITNLPRFLPDTPLKSVLDHPAWYDYRFIPVIDSTQRLLGALPYKSTREFPHKTTDQSTKEILATGSALGELYLIGITGLFQSVGK